MRRYTIAKTLTLFLDALSVVARRLPERRSEINVHTPGVHRSSNPLTKLGFSDGNVDQGASEATTTGRQFDISTPSHSLLLSFSFPSLLSQSHAVNTRW